MMRPTVLSYPPRHPYVDRLHGSVATLVHRDEPMPRIDRFYDPAWILANAWRWDIAHLHFGHEQHPVERVIDAVAAHRAVGVPVAFTVHDLQIPHLPPHRTDAVDLLVALAPLLDAVVTSTPGCAEVVRRLIGRRPTVIPHGPLVPASRRHRLRAHRRLALQPGGHILVHAGKVRPNLGLDELVAACRVAEPSLPVRILVRPSASAQVTRLVDGVRGIEVDVRERLSDTRFERVVADATALLLPYRWATHSGLLELAADVGTPVLRTAVGFLSEQPHTTPAGHDRSGIPVRAARVDVDALARALQRPIDPAPAPPEADRARQEIAVLDHHRRLYHRLMTCTMRHGSVA